MKHFKVLVLAILLATTAQAQLNYESWETVNLKDSFGDPTGKTVSMIFGKGTFSNSATTGRDLIVKLTKYTDSYILSLYEYSKPPAASLTYQSSYGDIRIKTEGGEVISLRVFAAQSGGILINKKSYSKFEKLLEENKGKTLKFLVNASNFGGSDRTKYLFTIIDKANEPDRS